MSELDCWLDQIAERPDDHVTRLVFADWLEERDYPQASAVRASRDAVECLLEFPAVDESLVCADRLAPTTHTYTGHFQSRRVLRPLFRLSGFSSWKIISGTFYPKTTANAVEIIVTQKTSNSTHIPAIIWRSFVSGGFDLTETQCYLAQNFSLSVSTDPPTSVNWSLVVEVRG